MGIKRLRNEKQRQILKDVNKSAFNKFTPEKIANYIDNNVTDLKSAKEVLKEMGKIILTLAKAMNLQ